MGMFDYVYYKGREHQTKDLDCGMDTYDITGDGRLTKRVYTPTGEIKKRRLGAVEFDFPVKAHTDNKDMDYHGFLNFYGNDTQTARWISYLAKFTDGVMTDIKEASPNNK